MKSLLVIDGIAVPKQRPQFVRSTGVAYTPKETREWEKYVAQCWDEQNENIIYDQPIFIHLTFMSPKVARQDIDNLVKSVLDGLQGHAYKNDNIITHIDATKIKIMNEETSRVVIRINTLDDYEL